MFLTKSVLMLIINAAHSFILGFLLWNSVRPIIYVLLYRYEYKQVAANICILLYCASSENVDCNSDLFMLLVSNLHNIASQIKKKQSQKLFIKCQRLSN